MVDEEDTEGRGGLPPHYGFILNNLIVELRASTFVKACLPVCVQVGAWISPHNDYKTGHQLSRGPQ